PRRGRPGDPEQGGRRAPGRGDRGDVPSTGGGAMTGEDARSRSTTSQSARSRPGRREFVAALALELIAAFVVVLNSAVLWADVVIDPTVSVPPWVSDELRGQAVAPAARALGLVGVAGVVALAGTRRIGRRVVGAVLALTGVGIVLASLFWSAETSWLPFGEPAVLRETGWSWVSVVAGAVVAVCG